MNKRMVFHIIGRILQVESILLVFPFITAIIYGEAYQIKSYLLVSVLTFFIGTGLTFLVKPKSRVIYAKEGFAVVSLAWIALSAIGAVPFVITGEIPSYIDAFFETVSGFTTTGSTILKDVESMSHASLFWRSFTHWIGGMGFLVFVMAIIPNISDRSMHLLKAEVPGPTVGKIVPRIKDTSKILYIIYGALTLIEIIMLFAGGMPLFDSILHSFGTAGTGGFGIKGDSIASYTPYCQWVIAVFMLLFGINFNLFYLLLIKRFFTAIKSSELWCYLSIITVSTGIIVINTLDMYEKISDCIRHSFFQVSAIITTTGYMTYDFDLWPNLSKTILLLLMFLGACAGSTGGGLKISRVMLLFKMISREIKKLVHPRSVSVVKFEGKTVEEKTLSSVSSYFAIYIICILLVFLLISFEPFGMESNFSAAVSCFNNIGPGFDAVGPTLNFADYSLFSKLILSAAMLLGRLEIFPLIIAFSSFVHKKGKM